MKKLNLALVIVSLGLLVFITGAKAQNIKEGQWTMTMVTKIDGMDDKMNEAMEAMENMPPEQKAMMEQMMGSMNMKMNIGSEGITTTVTECLSQDDPVPSMDEAGKNDECTETHTVDGNTIRFKVVCPENTSEGEMVYEGSTMSGKIEGHQMVDGKQTNMTITIDGKYEGPCAD